MTPTIRYQMNLSCLHSAEAALPCSWYLDQSVMRCAHVWVDIGRRTPDYLLGVLLSVSSQMPWERGDASQRKHDLCGGRVG